MPISKINRMPRGGRREGAGRKRGSRILRKTQLLAKETAEKGASPLEVLLTTMRAAWKKAAPNGEVVDFAEALIASQIAKDCAPYLHPRLNSERHQLIGPDGLPLLPPITQNVLIYLPDNGRDPSIVKIAENVELPPAPAVPDLIMRPDRRAQRELREVETANAVEATSMNFEPGEDPKPD